MANDVKPDVTEPAKTPDELATPEGAPLSVTELDQVSGGFSAQADFIKLKDQK